MLTRNLAHNRGTGEEQGGHTRHGPHADARESKERSAGDDWDSGAE